MIVNEVPISVYYDLSFVLVEPVFGNETCYSKIRISILSARRVRPNERNLRLTVYAVAENYFCGQSSPTHLL
jgi:hypothetical protein